MENIIAGIGRKRPQLNVPVECLELDIENPRLAKTGNIKSQFDLLKILYDEFDIEELAYSMSENGYFDEEPIIVIPTNLPKDFDFTDDIETQQKKLQKLVNDKKITFTVVEGNRRTATLKLLLNGDLRKKIKVSKDFPLPQSQLVINDLQIIPAIVYPNRDNISAYLGVRHIAGLLKWEAYAKASFLSSRIEEGIQKGQSIEESIKEVQRQTADRSDVIKKQYLCYKVLYEANNDLNFNIDNIKNKFSLITVALNSPSIRDFIGVKSQREVDFSKRIVPTKKLENLDMLLTWIFGNGKDKMPILTDSRNITSRLSPVLADEDSTDYLIRYGNLEEAYERSGGEKIFLLKKLNDGLKNMQSALSIAYNHKSEDVKALVDKCVSVSEELKKMIQ